MKTILSVVVVLLFLSVGATQTYALPNVNIEAPNPTISYDGIGGVSCNDIILRNDGTGNAKFISANVYFKFYDANGGLIGNTVTVSVNGIPDTFIPGQSCNVDADSGIGPADWATCTVRIYVYYKNLNNMVCSMDFLNPVINPE